MVLLLSILLAVVVAWYVTEPYFAVESGFTIANLDANSLSDQRARCVQVLKDLELDFMTGKVSEQDYGEMRRSLSAELAEILKKLDA